MATDPALPRARYASGVFWAGLNAGAGVVLPFALFVFFARTMSPAQVGLVALAMAAVELLKALGLPGLYEALLQQHDDLVRCRETALALLLVAGAVLLALYLLTLRGLGLLVDGVDARFWLLAFLGLRIPLDLASLQPLASLASRLAFRRVALRAVVSNSGAGAIGVAVALTWQPMPGLVAYQVAQSAFMFAGVAVGRGLLVRPRLHRDVVARLRHEALFATGNRALAAVINSLDQLVLAPIAGDVGLAYYNLGKRLETTFVTVASSFCSVLFQPLFAAGGAPVGRSGGTPPRAEASRRALAVLVLTCGVPAAVVAANGETVVGLVFGRQWLPAVPVAVLLSVNGFVRAVGMVPGAMLSVCGRNRALLATSVASAASGLLLVVALAPFSIAACAAALALKNAVIVGWMAWLGRDEAPCVLRTYALDVALPMALLLAASGLGARAAGVAAAGLAGPVPQFCALAASGLAALCCAVLVLGLRHATLLVGLAGPVWRGRTA